MLIYYCCRSELQLLVEIKKKTNFKIKKNLKNRKLDLGRFITSLKLIEQNRAEQNSDLYITSSYHPNTVQKDNCHVILFPLITLISKHIHVHVLVCICTRTCAHIKIIQIHKHTHI